MQARPASPPAMSTRPRVDASPPNHHECRQSEREGGQLGEPTTDRDWVDGQADRGRTECQRRCPDRLPRRAARHRRSSERDDGERALTRPTRPARARRTGITAWLSASTQVDPGRLVVPCVHVEDAASCELTRRSPRTQQRPSTARQRPGILGGGVRRRSQSARRCPAMRLPARRSGRVTASQAVRSARGM